MEEILTESEIKLDGVRQKILQVAQELSGEDMHQFHRAITTGEWVQGCFSVDSKTDRVSHDLGVSAWINWHLVKYNWPYKIESSE